MGNPLKNKVYVPIITFRLNLLILTIILVTLKLLNFVTWSWIWILSPLWLPNVLVGLTIALLIGVFGGIYFISGVISFLCGGKRK